MQVREGFSFINTSRNTYLPAIRRTKLELIHAKGILTTVIGDW